MHAECRIRMTPQRQVILEELEKSQCHPTADELYERVRRRLPRISLGTVYRNLEILANHSMIQKIDLGGNQRRFDSNPEFHYHIRCMQCGTLADVFLRSPSLINEMLTQPNGFDIYGVRLEFLGLCPNCKSTKANSR